MHRISEERVNGFEGDGGLQPGPVKDGIATKLKELYHSFESEAVPDALIRLLDRLDRAEKAGMTAGKSMAGSPGGVVDG